MGVPTSRGETLSSKRRIQDEKFRRKDATVISASDHTRERGVKGKVHVVPPGVSRKGIRRLGG